jgi:hypothetical protein
MTGACVAPSASKAYRASPSRPRMGWLLILTPLILNPAFLSGACVAPSASKAYRASPSRPRMGWLLILTPLILNPAFIPGACVAPSTRPTHRVGAPAVGAPPSCPLCELVSCPANNLAFVIPSEAKESLCEIAASFKLLAVTMHRSIRDMTLDR